jgi:hypothetical protein
MQGVDRIDQLIKRFSIAFGHTFKKWHKKLGMGFIDIARSNAYIARKMSGAIKKERDPHRSFMIDLSSELIHGDWKNAPGDSGMFFSKPGANFASFESPQPSPRAPSPARLSISCNFKQSSQVFPKSRPRRYCVVCRFEGRYPSEKTVYCYHHKVALCSTVHACDPVLNYMCPETETTCWDKFHTFYYPAGLFNSNGNIRRNCTLFIDMKKFIASNRVLDTIDEENEMASSNQVAQGPTDYSPGFFRSTIRPFTPDSIGRSSTSEEEMTFYEAEQAMSDHSSIDFGDPEQVRPRLMPQPSQVPITGSTPSSNVEIEQVMGAEEPITSSTPSSSVEMYNIQL